MMELQSSVNLELQWLCAPVLQHAVRHETHVSKHDGSVAVF